MGLGELISICGTSVLIADVAGDGLDGDCNGVTPAGRVDVLDIGRILSGLVVEDFIGGGGGTVGGVCVIIAEDCRTGGMFVITGGDTSCGRVN